MEAPWDRHGRGHTALGVVPFLPFPSFDSQAAFEVAFQVRPGEAAIKKEEKEMKSATKSSKEKQFTPHITGPFPS